MHSIWFLRIDTIVPHQLLCFAQSSSHMISTPTARTLYAQSLHALLLVRPSTINASRNDHHTISHSLTFSYCTVGKRTWKTIHCDVLSDRRTDEIPIHVYGTILLHIRAACSAAQVCSTSLLIIHTLRWECQEDNTAVILANENLPYLPLLCSTIPCHSLPYLPYLTLPYLTFLTLPYLTLPYLTLPYLTLPYLTMALNPFAYLVSSYSESNQLYLPHLTLSLCTLSPFSLSRTSAHWTCWSSWEIWTATPRHPPSLPQQVTARSIPRSVFWMSKCVFISAVVTALTSTSNCFIVIGQAMN